MEFKYSFPLDGEKCFTEDMLIIFNMILLNLQRRFFSKSLVFICCNFFHHILDYSGECR